MVSILNLDSLSGRDLERLQKLRGCNCGNCRVCANPVSADEEQSLKTQWATSCETYDQYIRARNALGYDASTAMRFAVWDRCEPDAQIGMAHQLTYGAPAHLKKQEAIERPAGWGDW